MPASNTSARRPRRLSAGTVLYYFVGLLVLAMVTAWATLLFGSVSGSEFSPETLQRREFSYYQLPLLGIQVTPLDRKPVTGSVEQYLLTNKIVAPIKPEKWDLIEGYEGATHVNPHGASILCTYFDAINHQNQPYWENWSKTHPQLAAILWPELVVVARLRFYEIIPDMMQLAESTDESQSQKFQTELNDVIIAQSLELAQWWEPINSQRARDLYQLILAKNPQHPRALQALKSLPPAETSNDS
jgi:hypothetical protein